MELCVLHYHFRPGGVRQVIAAGLPALAVAGGFQRVCMAGGEAPDEAWRGELERALHPLPVRWTIQPALGYWSETHASAEAVRAAQEGLSGGALWAHNLSVGRNFHLARAIAESAGKWSAVWLHHHDWWWDGRWERWPEMQVQGAESLEHALSVTLPAAENVRHFTINPRDASLLTDMTGAGSTLTHNALTWQQPASEDVDYAQQFLCEASGGRRVWLAPARVLRRKNLAEALLMQRELEPDACVLVTGGASSAAELPYFHALRGAGLEMEIAQRPDAPPVSALIAAADAIVITSLREGFGLPYYEAALAGRPLMARILDVMRGGPPVRRGWKHVRTSRSAYDFTAEQERTAGALENLRNLLPSSLRSEPAEALPNDFGSLSLAAQMEVLRAPAGSVTAEWQASGHGIVHGAHPVIWADRFLRTAQMQSPPRPGWGENAVRFLRPLVAEWLARPLLWPACA